MPKTWPASPTMTSLKRYSRAAGYASWRCQSMRAAPLPKSRVSVKDESPAKRFSPPGTSD
ncbi:MAG: hypothetical protein AW07_03166 [Candidatus Accumulibacter sp. SK-11]|nr:MAG: hypothetical protein AW07_03166 [Candidatus Accumulibacter sp. SK-11]